MVPALVVAFVVGMIIGITLGPTIRWLTQSGRAELKYERERDRRAVWLMGLGLNPDEAHNRAKTEMKREAEAVLKELAP